MSESTNPRQVAEQFVGGDVTITLINGQTRSGELLGCGESGLTLASGIGGRMVYRYGQIDAITGG